MPSFFARNLLVWHNKNPRPLPWDNGPRDPYHIWISEIIMQQTRIEQGGPFYLRFVTRFPTVQTLANASIDEVLRYWQGLGYYSRARNVHLAARHIVHDMGGVFPTTYAGLIMLPGIGPYSASAIASFAYGLPFPVVDGNVKRVIARFSGITSSIDEPAIHNQIRSIAAGFMKGVSPGIFNQAIMNFGALVCKPRNPGCAGCPLAKKCFAFTNNLVDHLPERTKKKSSVERHFHFVIISWRDKILLERREANDIWRGLYAPPLLERNSARAPSSKHLESFVRGITGQNQLELVRSSSAIKQLLSHQTILARFHFLTLLAPPKTVSGHFVWVTNKTIQSYARPKIIAGITFHKP